MDHRALSIAQRQTPTPARPSALTVPSAVSPMLLRQPRRGPAVVTEATMMSIPPLHAAMRVLSGAVASLPVLDRDGEAINLDASTSTAWQAHPTADSPWFAFVDSIMWLLMIHGNAILVPTSVSADGSITSLEIIHPDRVVPAWSGTDSAWTWDPRIWLDGELLGPADYIHLREISVGGYRWGLSRLKLLSQMIGLQASEQAHVVSTYDDGAQPTGYWRTAVGRDSPVLEEYAAQLGEFIGGRGNGVTVVGNDLRWEAVALNHADIQLLESRQWSTSQAASIIGVPPHLIGAASYDSDTYSNVRQDMELLESLTIMRYRRILEQGFGAHGLHLRLGPHPLTQPPIETLIPALATAIDAGICSAAQAARRLGWPAPEPVEPVEPVESVELQVVA